METLKTIIMSNVWLGIGSFCTWISIQEHVCSLLLKFMGWAVKRLSLRFITSNIDNHVYIIMSHISYDKMKCLERFHAF